MSIEMWPGTSYSREAGEATIRQALTKRAGLAAYLMETQAALERTEGQARAPGATPRDVHAATLAVVARQNAANAWHQVCLALRTFTITTEALVLFGQLFPGEEV